MDAARQRQAATRRRRWSRGVAGAALALAACLAGCSPRAAQPPPAGSGEPVSLRFGWPPGMQAQVLTQASRQRVIGSDTREGATTTSYALAVHADADGVLVQTFDVRAQVRSDGVSPQQQALLEFVTRASASLPVLLVAPSGQVLGLRGVAEMRRELLAAMTPLLTGPAEQTETMRQSFESLFAEERLSGVVTALWTPIVGAWSGADLVIGETYEGADQQPSPLVPGMPITMAYKYRVMRRLPCTAGATALACVEIRLISRPSDEALPAIRASMQQLFSMNAPRGATMPEIDDLEVKNSLTLITEPATLRPHRLVQERSISGIVEQGDQPDVAVRQTERAETTWTYR